MSLHTLAIWSSGICFELHSMFIARTWSLFIVSAPFLVQESMSSWSVVAHLISNATNALSALNIHAMKRLLRYFSTTSAWNSELFHRALDDIGTTISTSSIGFRVACLQVVLSNFQIDSHTRYSEFRSGSYDSVTCISSLTQALWATDGLRSRWSLAAFQWFRIAFQVRVVIVFVYISSSFSIRPLQSARWSAVSPQ